MTTRNIQNKLLSPFWRCSPSRRRPLLLHHRGEEAIASIKNKVAAEGLKSIQTLCATFED